MATKGVLRNIHPDLMATKCTLLCIHHNPAQLGLLAEHGYELLTVPNAPQGLRLSMSQPVDAIVLEYYLGLFSGLVIAAAIKQVRPEVPVIMLADNADLPSDDLKSVDALVRTSDGAHVLLAIIHFVLGVKARMSVRHKGRDRAAWELTAENTFRARFWNRIQDGTSAFGQSRLTADGEANFDE